MPPNARIVRSRFLITDISQSFITQVIRPARSKIQSSETNNANNLPPKFSALPFSRLTNDGIDYII